MHTSSDVMEPSPFYGDAEVADDARPLSSHNYVIAVMRSRGRVR